MTQSGGAENTFFSVTLYNFQKKWGGGGGLKPPRALKENCHFFDKNGCNFFFSSTLVLNILLCEAINICFLQFC